MDGLKNGMAWWGDGECPVLGRSFTAAPRNANPSATAHSNPYYAYFSLHLQNTKPCLLRFPPEQERFVPFPPHVSVPVAFQHLWFSSPNGAVEHPTSSSSSHQCFALTMGFGVEWC
ncbi:hypothetical protein AVEN_42437-1 [Araneus ventricosus]|uniref:Uncharacterized protein n=1 Tax=Araneus ventricosus TaxID=182803 RepID=A0A4Y2PX60_ARAVE|nr:hypothetical protein AVEN_42437-1 [Araneus ventricosus]